MNPGHTFHLNTHTPQELPVRDDIERIINAALRSVDPSQAMKNFFQYNGQIITVGGKDFVRTDFTDIFLIAIGKAAIPMIISAAEVLGDDFSSGLAVSKSRKGSVSLDPRIRVVIGDHPIPGINSFRAADDIMEYLEKVNRNDLVIFLISGGGSALISKPIQGVTFEDLQIVTQSLLNASVPIQKSNTLRKHLDVVKGGGLLKKALPAQIISLILSDVIGNDPSVIASGPTVPDPSTYHECLNILKDYDLLKSIPVNVLMTLREGDAGNIEETIKPAEVADVLHYETLIGNIDLAMNAIQEIGKNLGYRTIRSSEFLVREIEFEKNRIITEAANQFKRDVGDKLLMIWGGEVTVIRTGSGRGGRNQHLALLLAEEFEGKKGVVGVALATDGEDGSTDAAGAVIDAHTMDRARALDLDSQEVIRQQDSYGFFQELNDLIFTGSTGTNVNDLFILIKE